MSLSKFRLPTLTALVLGACSLMAQAETFTLNLNGAVANASSSSFDQDATTHVATWRLSLAGLDTASAITVSKGDFVEVTISLDAPLAVPSFDILSWYEVAFNGPDFPAGTTKTDNGTLDLKLAGSSVLSASGTNCMSSGGQLLNCRTFSAPDNQPMTIDQAIFKFEITDLSAPATLDSASFGYILLSHTAPVPEPMSALLLGAGLGVVAVSRRKGRSLK